MIFSLLFLLFIQFIRSKNVYLNSITGLDDPSYGNSSHPFRSINFAINQTQPDFSNSSKTDTIFFYLTGTFNTSLDGDISIHNAFAPLVFLGPAKIVHTTFTSRQRLFTFTYTNVSFILIDFSRSPVASEYENPSDCSQVGGAIRISALSHLLLKHSKFTGFCSELSGGIISIESNTQAEIVNTTFFSSHSVSADYRSNGGALFIQNSKTNISNSEFISNTVFQQGGAIHIDSSVVDITTSRFDSNIAGSQTENDDNGGGAIYQTANSNVSISESYFGDNIGDSGGAIFVDDGFLDLQTTDFYANVVGFYGPALFLQNIVGLPFSAKALVQFNNFSCNTLLTNPILPITPSPNDTQVPSSVFSASNNFLWNSSCVSSGWNFLSCPQGMGQSDLPHYNDLVCVQCRPGTSSNSTNLHCDLCAAGSFSNTDGALACQLCPADSFQPSTGATECTYCLGASVGATSCVDGNDGSLSTNSPDSSDPAKISMAVVISILGLALVSFGVYHYRYRKRPLLEQEHGIME